MANPWAHSRTENEIGPSDGTGLISTYAVPAGNSDESLHDGWVDVPGLGYAPSLRISPVGEPDATRLNNGQWVVSHPVDGEDNTRAYWNQKGADRAARESVVDTDSTGFQETKQIAGYPLASAGFNRYAPNPRSVPPPEPRPTTGMSPHTWRFWRPFGHNLGPGSTPNRFNGVHFSMADHRRNYQIYGQTPARHPGASTRNTYRLPPTPWDVNIVDLPPTDTSAYPDAEYTDLPVPAPNRSYRLG